MIKYTVTYVRQGKPVVKNFNGNSLQAFRFANANNGKVKRVMV